MKKRQQSNSRRARSPLLPMVAIVLAGMGAMAATVAAENDAASSSGPNMTMARMVATETVPGTVPETVPGSSPQALSGAVPDAVPGAIATEPPVTAAALPRKESVTAEQALLERVDAMNPVRVVMHAREPSDRLAVQIGSLLTALGVSQIERRIVEAVPDDNQIRYYHEADREAGQVVGEALSLVFDNVAVRDFRSYSPAPSEGLVEIWLR